MTYVKKGACHRPRLIFMSFNSGQVKPESESPQLRTAGSQNDAIVHSARGEAGLSSTEAAERLQRFGPNSTADEKESDLHRFIAKLITPVPMLLEVTVVLQLFLHEYIEAGVVAVLLLFNAILAFIQEQRAQRTIEALKAKLALWSTVRRDGVWKQVLASQIVPDDVLKLSLGTVVPADVRLLRGDISLDHSMITGESLPIDAGEGFNTFAGAAVRRGEAVGLVTATGANTRFGRAAELVRTAHVTSTQQKAIFGVVRNLTIVNGVIAAALIGYAYFIGLPTSEFVPLALIALLATVPVALPATFTLATALAAQSLAKRGVLLTRLSAADEAASIDVLCSDKTGTLTKNELALTAVDAFGGYDRSQVVGLAAFASADSAPDAIDRAVRAAVTKPMEARLIKFVPFDPNTKTAEAVIALSPGNTMRVVKGAFATVARMAEPNLPAENRAKALESAGNRVLGLALGSANTLRIVGVFALSDAPRPDAAQLVGDLRKAGIKVVMVTGDAPSTAAVIAANVGISGPVHSPAQISDGTSREAFGVFAGVLPEDKFNLVKQLQKDGHTVGMCGDGANDAPALRQAHLGIAVSTASDVAKSAAGMVLTNPGLGGVLAAVTEGRVVFQRILTYTLRSLVNKVRQVLFLSAGLLMTGHAVLTPMLMVLLMITGDFLAMSSTTDNVRPSTRPNQWRIWRLTFVGAVLGLVDLAFCAGVLAYGDFALRLPIDALQTLTLVTLVFNGQAVFYVVRERGHLWSSWPSRIMILSSIADLTILPGMALKGFLMTPLPISVILGSFAAAVVLAFFLDWMKLVLFARLRVV